MPSTSSGPRSSGSWPRSSDFSSRHAIAVLPTPPRPTTVIIRIASSLRKSPIILVSTWRSWNHVGATIGGGLMKRICGVASTGCFFALPFELSPDAPVGAVLGAVRVGDDPPLLGDLLLELGDLVLDARSLGRIGAGQIALGVLQPLLERMQQLPPASRASGYAREDGRAPPCSRSRNRCTREAPAGTATRRRPRRGAG